MSRADEIAQGLRHPEGPLTFVLDVLEYVQGRVDFEAGTARPDNTSPSYDLGRWRAQEEAEAMADFHAKLKADRDAARTRMRLVLADHPEALARYEADIAAISLPHP